MGHLFDGEVQIVGELKQCTSKVQEMRTAAAMLYVGMLTLADKLTSGCLRLVLACPAAIHQQR